MSIPAIKVEGLWKEYSLGATQKHQGSFYDLMAQIFRAPFSRLNQSEKATEQFWALHDVNFEIQPGEVLGVIGRNGAGKSTLLKILSRITAPTHGGIRVRGRMASLLEVGTGFHPELSGRENIFLNGAILGMTRKEVARRFDEIVAFAEVERFIDTPVKRYSSGMYVRLAFAVAAHLEPDILIIDEVLAVGDAEFQKKCLGKINDVATGGRTVLFVSHNMQAVQSLCNRCLLMENGTVSALGLPDDITSMYLASTAVGTATTWHSEKGLGNQSVSLKGFVVKSKAEIAAATVFPSNADISVEMHVELEHPQTGLCVGFDLIGRDGETILRSYNTDVAPEEQTLLHAGTNLLCCLIPRGLLNAGAYQIAPRISIHNQEWISNGEPLVGFSVILNHGESPFWNSLDEQSRPGRIAPIFRWINFNKNDRLNVF